MDEPETRPSEIKRKRSLSVYNTPLTWKQLESDISDYKDSEKLWSRVESDSENNSESNHYADNDVVDVRNMLNDVYLSGGSDAESAV